MRKYLLTIFEILESIYLLSECKFLGSLHYCNQKVQKITIEKPAATVTKEFQRKFEFELIARTID